MDLARPVSRSSMEGRPEITTTEALSTNTTAVPPVRLGPEPPPKLAKELVDPTRHMSTEPTNPNTASSGPAMLPPLPLPPPSALAAPAPGQTPGLTLATPGPSVLPGLASLTSVSSPFPPHPAANPSDDRAKTPAPGLSTFLPPIGSVSAAGTPGPNVVLPAPGPNSVALGLGSVSTPVALPAVGPPPGHNMNPNALSGVVDSARSYSPPRTPMADETPAGSPSSPEARPLNVKDALSYLEMVKIRFQDKPEVYNHFLDIMKDFKSQAIDTPGVIDRVSGLFNGHTVLIQGFNTFLPLGYRIDCTVDQHDHSLITVTTPSGTITQTAGGPPRHIPPSQPVTSAPYTVTIHPLPGVSLPPVSLSYHNSPATVHEIATLQGGPSLLPGAAAAPSPGPAVIPNPPTSSTPVPHVESGPGAKGGPMVEFNQAVNYVNKIKQRFASDPDTYKQFLEILQTYQKEQRPIAEVYQQVNVLFNNQRDLLEDFQHFLPDNGAAGGSGAAGGGVMGMGGGGLFGMMAHIQAAEWGRVEEKSKGKEAGGSVGPGGSKASGSGDKDKRKDGKEREREREKEKERERLEKEREKEKEKGKADSAAAKRKKRGLEKEVEKNGKAGNSKRTKVIHQGAAEDLPYTNGSPPPAHPYHSNPNQPSTSHLAHTQPQNPLTTPDELAFFERVKKSIDDRTVYHEFLKVINLFVQEIIDVRTLIDRARGFLNEELVGQFKEILGWDDRAVEVDLGMGGADGAPVAPALDRPRVDLNSCPKFGPSYRRLPTSEINLACSGRDAMCWEVLNDEWVSHPTWLSEESGFTTGKKNSYEDALHKSEEERHEYDFNIEALLRTIAILEPIKARIEAMDPEKRASFTLDPHLGGQSRGIYQRVIKKVYDKNVGAEVIRALHENPSVAVRVVLDRLKQKEEEWKRAQREWNKVWREVEARNFYKSLDHQGANIKANDKKALMSKQLVLEAEARRKEGVRTRQRMVDPVFRRTEREAGSPPAPASGTGAPTGSGMGMSFVVDDMSVIQDLMKLVFVYLDRTAASQYSPDERKRIERFLRTFVPMVFMQDHAAFDAAFGEAMEGGDLDVVMGAEDTTSEEAGRKRGGGDLRKKALKNKSKGGKGGVPSAAAKEGSARASPMAVDTEPVMPENTDALPEGVWVRMDEGPGPNASGSGNGKRTKGTMYVNNAIYALLRIIQIWYSRFASLKKLAKTLSESNESSYLENPLAVQLGLNDAVPPSAHRLVPNIPNPASEFYMTLLDASERMFDGEIDWQQFEEVARFMFGTKAYVVFTIDILAGRIIKQAQIILADSRWPELYALLQKERRETAPGPSSQFLINYRRQVEALIAGEESREKDNSNLNVHRIVWNHERKTLGFQLLARDDMSVYDSETMNGRWRQYIDSYVLTHQTEGLRSTIQGPILRRNLRNADATEDTPKYHAEGGLHIKVDMLTYRLFFVSRTEETYCRERTSPEVRQLDEQAKKTSLGRAKAFDTWLSSRTESKSGEGQKQDDVSMEL